MKKISTTLAYLLCLNSISGAGVFVNTRELYQILGVFAPFVYPLAAIILFPVVFSLLRAAQRNPSEAGLFVIVRSAFGPNLGFFATWAYFLFKIVSASVLITAFAKSLVLAWPTIFSEPLAKIFLLLSIVISNIAGVRLGGKIQYFFTAIKGFAYLTIFVGGFAFGRAFTSGHIANIASSSWAAAIPIAIFGLVGFEILPTIAHQLEHPQKIVKVGLAAFATATAAYFLFQFCAVRLAAAELVCATDPLAALSGALCGVTAMLGTASFASMKTATIAGAFSSLTNNCWNIRALSDQIPFGRFLKPVNSHGVPWAALLFEAFLAALMLMIPGQLFGMTSLAVLAACICFFFAAAASLRLEVLAVENKSPLAQFIAIYAVISSVYLLGISARNVMRSGLSLPFLGFFLLGLGLWAIGKIYSRVETAHQ